MTGPVESYFSKTAYLPVQSAIRANLKTVIESTAPQEVRRTAIEEAAYAFPLFSYNLLKLVNSSVFNLKSKVVTLKQAATLPTFDMLADLIRSMPEYPADMEPTFSAVRFEEHGRATALTVQLLSSLGRRFSTLDRERFYTSALLHDVGRIFLLLSDVQGYRRIIAENTESTSVIDAEKKYYGTDHATVGVLALEAIGIGDADLLNGVRQHHETPSGPGVLVAYADRIVKRFGIGPSLAGAMSVSPDAADDARLKVALEETIHMTVGDALMHVLSEIDSTLSSGMPQYKSLIGAEMIPLPR